MGGRALVAHYLLTLVPPGADPFGPENIFVLAPGIVTGSPSPARAGTASAPRARSPVVWAAPRPAATPGRAQAVRL